MTTLLVTAAALALDWTLGEPRRFHPLVGFGRLATLCECWGYGGTDVSPRKTHTPSLTTCRFCGPLECIIGHERVTVLHCWQGVRGAPERFDCPTYQRESGADDE